MQQWGATWENRVSQPAKEAADDLRALNAEIGSVGAELARLSSQRVSVGGGMGAAFSGAVSPAAVATVGQATATKSPWENLAGKGGKDKAQALLDGPKASPKAAKSDAGADGLAKAKQAANGLKGGLGQAAAAGSFAKTAVMGLAAAVGVAGGAGLFRLAMGWQGVAKLQAITFRAQMNLRSLFKGVDSAPVLRAANLLASQLSKSTVTGTVLSGVLTRGFNGFFQGLEKATPYLIAMGQGALLAAAYMENAWLKARMKLYPLTSALGDLIAQEDALEAAAVAGGGAFVAMGAYAAVALAPMVPLAAAVTAVSAAIQQLIKLSSEWDENSLGQMAAKLGQDLGLTSAADAEKAAQMKARGAYEKAEADRAKAKAAPKAVGGDLPAQAKVGGQGTGKALGDGIVDGLAGSEAAVKVAGGKLADAANKGVREKAQIKSPSRMMKVNARYMGQGVEQGLDESRGGVQRAADRSLVPDVSGGGGAPSLNLGGMSGGGIHIANVSIAPSFPNVTSGNPADIVAAILAAAPQLGQAIFRDVAHQLGVPTGEAA